MSTVYLGIGSNIGDKKANCEEAVSRLREINGVEITARSRFYQTRAVGGPPQEDYINGVIKIETDILPGRCLRILKGIEKEMGRKPAGKHHPRIIDMDILLYDDVILKEKDLVIPHPGMDKRYFVLRGFSEIAPKVVHPVLKKTMKELYEKVNNGDNYNNS